MSDHYLGMLDMKRDVGNATRDQLTACLLELLDDVEVNTSAHLLATIARHTNPATIRYREARAAATDRHDYEPGETTHPMKTDPDCRVCGEARHD